MEKHPDPHTTFDLKSCYTDCLCLQHILCHKDKTFLRHSSTRQRGIEIIHSGKKFVMKSYLQVVCGARLHRYVLVRGLGWVLARMVRVNN